LERVTTRIAIFGGMIDAGVPRGALRLFRALAEELARRTDVEFICLGEPVFDPSDPLGCTYECWDGGEFISVLPSGDPPKAAEANVPPAGLASPGTGGTWVDVLERYAWAYRQNVPLSIRRPLSGITRRIRPVILTQRQTHASVPVMNETRFPEALFRPGSSGDPTFRNTDIVGKIISLEAIDVVLDFWWFHSPHPNPLAGRYRPAGTRVICWFLDAIPLRVAHWQSGLIPVPEFRGAIQPHLERADEIVAISRSAARDIATFFPHIRKPVHVVPCGIFEADFEVPERNVLLPEAMRIDPATPLFTMIGFHESSKNVPNALRGILKASRALDAPLQVFIIGVGDEADLEEALGPLVEELNRRVRVNFGVSVSDAVKRAVLARSTALLYPSKWEGFGIPPLEAMAAGTQVIVSDIPPLREVCADLAEYCDPYDADSIAAAIVRTLRKSPGQLVRHVERAREHARRYAWSAAVTRLLDAISRAPRVQTSPLMAANGDD
jgi:glycosyltransferase involved in cell wall biosynthesis